MSRVLLILISLSLQAQVPVGRLYFLTGTGGIPLPYVGYIQYPESINGVVDSIQAADIAMIGGKLFVAGVADVMGYDTSGFQRTDTLGNVHARHIAAWEGSLAAASGAHPYFRLYDIPSRSLIFSLDTLKLREPPADIAVWDDKAFLLLQNSVLVVDLTNQDTIATIATPHPFLFAGYNYFIIDAGADFYIDVEYITGAIRFSLLKMDKTNFQVETVFHNESYANYSEPVVAEDKIYLGAFDTHYSIPEDSLYLAPYTGQPLVIEHDDASNALFLYHNSPNGISYHLDGSFSDTLTIQGYLVKALFVPATNDSVTHIAKAETQRVISYPNPVSDILTMEVEGNEPIQGVQTMDVSGKITDVSGMNISPHRVSINYADLPPGFYFVKIFRGKDILITRFIKE